MSEMLSGGERRFVSVLMLDLADSSVLSSRLDPEDYSEIIERLGSLWHTAIDEVGGTVLKWTGDGLVAMFGFPHPHDNDAVRAVTAGLRILELTDAERATGRLAPPVRMGLHTGLALVNQIRASDRTHLDVLGDTPAIAARLEAMAPLNGLVVSDATAKLVERDVELELLGPRPLKGFDYPVVVHRVVGRREVPLDAWQPRIVGRAAELAALEARWEAAAAGACGTVLVRAPAGAGKSRLVTELADRLQAADHEVLVLRCAELMRTTALHPVVWGFRVLLGWKPDLPNEELLERIEAEVSDLPVPGAPSLLASLLGLPVTDPEVLALDPSRRRANLLQLVLAWVERRTRQGPRCVLIEDLHWADPSTAELVGLLVHAEATLPLLVVVTCRTGQEPTWESDECVTVLDLPPLLPVDAVALVEEVAGDRLPAELTTELLERSDAVPLFLCELTRAVLSSGVVRRGPDGYELDGDLDKTDVPSSLQDSLMMRLDGLGRSRSLASLAATIGRTFDLELLRAVADTDAVEDELDQMVSAGVLVHAPMGTDSRYYTFGHALVREAAYQSITRRTRREWHGRIADVLAGRPDPEPTMLAHHLTEAGRTSEAVEMWATAARLDFANAAYDESITHFQRGLELLAELPPDVAAMHEFGLRLGAGLAYATRLGYASPEAEQSYQRAYELAAAFTGPEAFPAVLGLWAYDQVRSVPVRRRELGTRAHALAELTDDVAMRLEGISALSTTLGFEGDFDEALELMTEGIELFDGTPDTDLGFFMPQHPVAGFVAISGPLLWARGELRAALQRYERCREFAEHPVGPYGPFTSGYAHTFCAWMCGLRGDYAGAAAHAQAAIDTASHHGFLVWIGAAVPHLGIATAMLGDPAAGIALIEQGLAGWHAAGSRLFVSYWQHGLALAYEAAGDVPAAVAAVDEGILHSERHAERFHLAELHRLRGRLLASTGETDAAEEARRRAVDVAAAQGAKLFELLALGDLAASARITDKERGRMEQVTAELTEEVEAVPGAREQLAAAWR